MSTAVAQGNHHPVSYKNFQIRVMMAVLLILSGWLFVEYTSLLYKSYQIEVKKQWFMDENQRLVETNQDLEKRYEYYQTDYFFRKEAKRKLNRKSVGEKVVIVTGGDERIISSNDWIFEEDLSSKWMQYLFARIPQID
ncbi:MAG: hypothetical protein P1V18_04835 [Candidatus Gracilibacteria bacterium]|nr:hypothetical protein [Candidatus Gracilibacteria bacterium]